MILVTGGTGLVGAHLMITLLERNKKVRATYRHPERIENTKRLFTLYDKEDLFSQIEWISCDILDVTEIYQATKNIEHIYHCAAEVSLSSGSNHLYKVNIEGTANVVNAAIANSVKKLCYVSSIAALGEPTKESLVIDEENIWNPNSNHTDYAITKYGGELEVFRASQEGVEVIIVNPGIILGPEFWDHGSARYFSILDKGFPFYTKGISGFVAVIDLVEIMIRLMESSVKNERFVVVAENLPLNDFLFTIADSIKAEQPKYAIRPWMTLLTSKIDGILHFLHLKNRSLTSAMSKSAHSKTTFSSQKLQKTLDYQFTNITTYIYEIGNYYLKRNTKN